MASPHLLLAMTRGLTPERFRSVPQPPQCQIPADARPKRKAQADRRTEPQSGEMQHHEAHVATFGERARDVFYVTDLLGAQITAPTRQAAIRSALLHLLSSEQVAA